MDVPAAHPPMLFDVLGPLRVRVDGVAARLGGPRQVAVLAHLLLHPGATVSDGQLIEGVWPDAPPARPQLALRSYVSHLRRMLEPDRDRGDRRSLIERTPRGYRLTADSSTLDWLRFEALLDQGSTALGIGDHRSAAGTLRQASDLWRGEPCEGVIDSEAVSAFRVRMEHLHVSMTELWLEARLGVGPAETVVADLTDAIEANPLRERLTELGMLALYRAGRQSDALALCNQLRTRLREALGIDPSPPVQQLEHRILTHDVVGDAAARAGTGRGSVAPTGSDRSWPAVVGRRTEMERLTELGRRLDQGRGGMALLVGGPGSGKTTLISALADDLEASGATVAWGWSRPVAAEEPLWAWHHALEQLSPSEGTHPEAEPVEAGPGGAEPARLAIEVEQLRRLAERAPVVVVIEDAHWADPATLDLLAFAGEALARSPVGFVVSWRPGRTGGDVSARLRALSRLGSAIRVDLGDLPPVAVDDLLDAAGIGDRNLGREIAAASGGNLLFASELVAQAARDQLDGRPSRVAPTPRLREVAIDEITSLHPAAIGVLTVAALVGDGFEADIVADASLLDPATVDEVLLAAMEGGAVRPTVDDPGRYRFAAPIVARILADSLPGTGRARLHTAIGHALWRRGGRALEAGRHFACSGSAAGTVLATRLGLEAAQGELSHTALEEVERLVDSGRETVGQLEGSGPLALRMAVFSSQIGRLRHDRGQQLAAADAALALAFFSDDIDELAATALATTGPTILGPFVAAATSHGLEPDPAWAVSVLGRARSRLPVGHRLGPVIDLRLARLDQPIDGGPEWRRPASPGPATAIDAPDDHRAEAISTDTSPAMRAEAISTDTSPAIRAEAISTDTSPAIRAEAFELALTALADGGAGSRRGAADRLVGTGSEPASELAARLRLLAWLGEPTTGEPPPESGPPHRPASPVETEALGRAVARWLATGQLDQAEDALAALAEGGWAAASTTHRLQLLLLRWYQGKFDEAADLATSPGPGPAGFGNDDLWRATLWAECGRSADALAALGGTRPEPLTTGPSGAIQAALHVTAAAALGVTDGLAEASEALARLRSEVVASSDGLVVLGPTAYFAGLACRALGDGHTGDTLLAAAIDQTRRAGATAWLIRALAARGSNDPGIGPDRGDGWPLDEARRLASETSMGWLDAVTSTP